MSDQEFELLDQLYFVTPYAELAELTGFGGQALQDCLWQLIARGWVKYFAGPDNELKPDETDFRQNFAKYQYLATRQGLLEHNRR